MEDLTAHVPAINPVGEVALPPDVTPLQAVVMLKNCCRMLAEERNRLGLAQARYRDAILQLQATLPPLRRDPRHLRKVARTGYRNTLVDLIPLAELFETLEQDEGGALDGAGDSPDTAGLERPRSEEGPHHDPRTSGQHRPDRAHLEPGNG